MASRLFDLAAASADSNRVTTRESKSVPLLTCRKSQAHMIPSGMSDAAKVTARWDQITPEMPAEQAVEKIDKSVDDKHPRKGEMP